MRFSARTLLASSVAVLASSFTLSAAENADPSASGPTSPTISQFLRIRTPGSLSLAPDGTLYCRDFPDGVNQLYRRPANNIDAPLERLTNFKDGLSSYAVSPDGKWLTLEAATGGNEQNQVYLFNPATKEIKPLLENPKVVFGVGTWLRDSSGFIYRANDVNERDFYIYRFDLATGKSTRLLDKPGSWAAGDVSLDGTRVLVSLFKSASDSRAYELNTKSSELTDLSATPESQPSANFPGGYLPGDNSVLIASDFDGGVERLYIKQLGDSGLKPREALPDMRKFELDGAQTNLERSIIATIHNEDGFGILNAYSLPKFEKIELPQVEKGLVGVPDIQGRTIVYSTSNMRTPGLAFAIDIPAAGGKAGAPRQLTKRLDSEPIDLSNLPKPQLVKFKSFDGLEIPAFLYLPDNFKKGQPIPFVVEYHGGPEGQSRPGFDRETSYFLSRGYGLMQPNVRGSTGYGREFHMLDNYKNRWNSVKDGVEAARWLVKEGYAKAGKISAFGGSYGGFMSVATIVEDAQNPGPMGPVFGASINVVGVVNFQTFLEQTKGYRQKLREAEYGPLTDPEFLASVSPIHKIDYIRVPMLIAHGLNDPRVPVGEAMQLAVGLQKRGFDPMLVYFPDEGHGFAKLDNRIIFFERAVKFLESTIGN